MLEKSKYLLMQESEVTDELGNKYPDLATFVINKFTPTVKGIDYPLTYPNCLRFFDLTYDAYQDFNFYDDITLWLNDVEYISDTDTNFDRYIKFYAKTDLNKWLLDYSNR